MEAEHLILLTAGFPFGDGEPFLEAEIPHLANCFPKITIIAAANSTLPMRPLPTNVTVISFTVDVSPTLHSNTAYLAILSYFEELFRNFWTYRIIPRRSAFLQMLAVWKEALPLAELLDSTIQNSGIPPARTTLYSYWLTSMAVAAALVKKASPELRAVSRTHGWDLYFERIGTGYLPLRPFLLRTLDRVYCCSGQGAAYFDRKMGFHHSSKIEVRYLGSRGMSLPRSRQVHRTEPFRIVSCAWLVALKRIDLLVDALAVLAARPDLPEIEWCHLGGGPLEDEIRQQISRVRSSTSNVDFRLLGNFNNTQVLEFYQSTPVDLFVGVSKWEGLPVSMMEAASFGIPIIATNVGGVSEIVIHGDNGYLLPSNPTAPLIADGLEGFIRLSDGQRDAMGWRSRAVWERHFDANTVFEDFAMEIKGVSDSRRTLPDCGAAFPKSSFAK
jgi:colanic acid/amylovoran biosynthesis glycosyltransferase